MYRFILLAALLLFGMTGRSLAVEGVREDYPGLAELPDGTTIVAMHVSLNLAQQCIYSYASVYGEWPASWQEVRDSGICQVALYSPGGVEIDPDDGVIDYLWDFIYVPAADLAPPETVILGDFMGDVRESHDPFEENSSLDERLANMREESRAYFEPLFADMNWRRLYAIQRVCNMMSPKMTYSPEKPTELQEFLESEYSPIKADSTNPLTGEQFQFNSQPNDFMVMTQMGGWLAFQVMPASGEMRHSLIP